MSVKDRGFLISKSAFQEDHYIVKYLTENHGLMSFILPNEYKHVSQSRQHNLQYGALTELVFKIKPQLSSLYQVHLLDNIPSWKPITFVFQQYVHEIILYLLMDKQENNTFTTYQQLITIFNDLTQKNYNKEEHLLLIEIALRHFELIFLDAIGFGINFSTDIPESNLIEDAWFQVISAIFYAASNSSRFLKNISFVDLKFFVALGRESKRSITN